MRILLTSPLMTYEDRWGQYHRGAGDTFPVGIGSIAGYLEANGYSPDVLEPDIVGLSESDFRELLKSKDYQLVGISAFTPNVHLALRTVSVVKETIPGVNVVMGGAHPTLFPESTLRDCPDLDFVVIREGEIPMLKLVETLAKGGDPADVPNLFFRQGDAIIKSLSECPWLNLDELPPFPYHLFDMNMYEPSPSLRKSLPTFNYMAQRGCPFSCSFCDTRTHGRKVRYRSVDKVMDDIVTLKSQYDLKGLIFEGSNFTVNTDWVEELCRRLISERLHLDWYCMGRVDVDLELLPLMRQAGLWGMSFGIESANLATLKRMRKQVTPEVVHRTIAALRRLDVRTIGSFILGYPGEDEADVRRTIEYSCDLKLDVAVFFIPVPFPGTELYEDASREGGLRENLTWKDYAAWLDHNHPIYINPSLGKHHVELYNYAFRRFYLRPEYVLRQLTQVRSWQDISRLLQGFRSISGIVKKYFKHAEDI